MQQQQQVRRQAPAMQTPDRDYQSMQRTASKRMQVKQGASCILQFIDFEQRNSRFLVMQCTGSVSTPGPTCVPVLIDSCEDAHNCARPAGAW
jgi:hypothetical protein